MTAREITEAINAKLNDYFPHRAAGDVRPDDRIRIGDEWVTVTDARPENGLPNRIRITGVLGEPTPGPADPDDVVTIRIRSEASIRRAAR